MKDEITQSLYICHLCKRGDLKPSSLAMKNAHLAICGGHIHAVQNQRTGQSLPVQSVPPQNQIPLENPEAH